MKVILGYLAGVSSRQPDLGSGPGGALSGMPCLVPMAGTLVLGA